MTAMPDASRIRGALLGVAVGDALGWPMEDRGGRVGGTARVEPEWRLVSWRRREGGSYGSHEQVVEAGEVSDDTQLTIAVARSAGHRDWWEHFTRVELPMWSTYERGGGGATKRAAQAWLRGRPPWSHERPEAVRRYFNAGGNGTAMRCLPHCLISRDWSEVARRVDLDGVATHGHPRALLGARVYAWAAWWGLRRTGRLRYGELLDRVIDASSEWSAPPALPEPWSEAAHQHAGDDANAWRRTVDELLELLEIARSGIQEGAIAVDRPVLDRLGAFGPTRGSGTVTSVAAIFLATRYVSQPQQALLAAAFARGADTDTLAAMTGGLLGCLDGPDWLWPLSEGVQDARYLERLAAGLAGEAPLPMGSSEVFDVGARRQLYRWLDKASAGDIATLPAFGRSEISSIADHPARLQFVRTWHLHTEHGQTIQIKRYDKGRQGRARWSDIDDSPSASDMAARREARPADPPTSPEPSSEPRAGLVLRVADLDRASRFYSQVIGLRVHRVTDRYVSFGWLALEPDDRVEQLAFLPDTVIAMPAVRVYLPPDALDRMRTRISELGIRTQSVTSLGASAFRASDMDGHPIEFVARNGSAPPV